MITTRQPADLALQGEGERSQPLSLPSASRPAGGEPAASGQDFFTRHARSAEAAPAPRAARRALRLLRQWQIGQLELHLPGGAVQRVGQLGTSLGQPHEGVRTTVPAVLHVHDWALFAATLKSGDIGFAESYIAGHWSTPDLAHLLTLVAANRAYFERMVYGAWWGRAWYRLRHWLNRNSKEGSRRNIHAHYDLGNDFYAIWLDPTMNYSSAWFQGQREGNLATAQWAKIDRALAEVQLQPGQRLLEIGCGWGAVAEAATRRHQAHVTGVTLSTEQLAYAQQRLSALGVADQADLRLQDYRDIDDAPFDAVVSIEMIEAVGQAYWPTYFAQLARSLKPGGRACIQSITLRDDLFERYTHSSDFIQQYIFPGGMLPSVPVFEAEARRAGLEVERTLAFGRDYAETLRRWRQQFDRCEAEVRGLGFDTRFIRTWGFYLAYCEAAFETGNTDVVQFTLRKPK